MGGVICILNSQGVSGEDVGSRLWLRLLKSANVVVEDVGDIVVAWDVFVLWKKPNFSNTGLLLGVRNVDEDATETFDSVGTNC